MDPYWLSATSHLPFISVNVGTFCSHRSREGKLTLYQGSLLCRRIVLTMRMCFLQLSWSFSPGDPLIPLIHIPLASLGSQNTLHFLPYLLIHLFIQYIFFPSESLHFPKHFFIHQMGVIRPILQVFMGAHDTGKAGFSEGVCIAKCWISARRNKKQSWEHGSVANIEPGLGTQTQMRQSIPLGPVGETSLQVVRGATAREDGRGT